MEFRIERKNAPAAPLEDLYYHLTRLPWRYLILFTFLLYLLINLIFGVLYFGFHEGLNPPNLGFMDCFFFSVHTFSTVGYGSISPNSLPVHCITVVEIFMGLISLALITGLFFSKFSRPSARFMFTDKILVTHNEGQPVLMFRIANSRSNRVMDAEVNLVGLYNETNKEGIQFRRFVQLPLLRHHTPIFAMSLSGIHVLDPISEGLLQKLRSGENIEFLISIKGLDETFGQTIHSTKFYRAHDVDWNQKQFVDILSLYPDGRRAIDFKKFNDLK